MTTKLKICQAAYTRRNQVRTSSLTDDYEAEKRQHGLHTPNSSDNYIWTQCAVSQKIIYTRDWVDDGYRAAQEPLNMHPAPPPPLGRLTPQALRLSLKPTRAKKENVKKVKKKEYIFVCWNIVRCTLHREDVFALFKLRRLFTTALARILARGQEFPARPLPPQDARKTSATHLDGRAVYAVAVQRRGKGNEGGGGGGTRRGRKKPKDDAVIRTEIHCIPLKKFTRAEGYKLLGISIMRIGGFYAAAKHDSNGTGVIKRPHEMGTVQPRKKILSK